MNATIEGYAAPRQRRTARIVIGATVALAVVALPFARVSLPVVPVLLPMVGAIAAVAQLLTAVMLYSRYRASGLPSLAILSTLYATSLFTSLAFLVSMPDVASQTGLFRYAARLGAWYYGAGVLLFVIQLVAYVAADDAERRNRNATARQIFMRTFVATVGTIGIGMLLVPLLGSPVAGLMQGQSFFALRIFILVPLLLLAIAISYAYLNVVFRRRMTMVRLWLGVVVLCTFLAMLVSMELAGQHFSVGWVAVLGFWLVQATVFLVAMIANVYDTLSMLSLRNEALYEQSVSDELTGLLNRRGFNLRFEEQVRRSARTEEALALLLIDIDDFKRFNDTYGHQSGDRAIAGVARVVASMLRRAGDAGARIGGDEFAVLLPKTDMAGAVAVAERIRGAVERLALAQGEGARFDHLTVTVGVTSVMLSGTPTLESNASLETSVLLGRADAALYAAKDAGRNCVRYRQISVSSGGGTSLTG